MRIFSKNDLYKLIFPLIGEQILAVTVGMADTVMVSVAGEAAVAGVSLVDTINVLLINIFSAIATGGAVVSARYLGKKSEEEACRAADQQILSIFLISFFVMVLSLFGNRIILKIVFGNVESAVLSSASIYFYLTAMSFPFLAIYSGSAALCRSMGNSRITLMVSLLINGINIIGNAVTVYCFHMAASGVGLATLLSRMIGAIVILVVVHDQRHPVHINKNFKFGFYPAMIKKIAQIGIPTGLDSCIFQIGKIMVQSLVSTFGTTSIAANAVVNNLSGFCTIPASAIGLSMITVIGQSIGARAFEDVKFYIKKLLKYAYLAMAGLNTVIILLSKYIVRIYKITPEATTMAWKIIISYSACAILIWPLAFALPNALRASDDARYTMIVSILSMWTFRVGSSYLLNHFFHLGLYGTWLAMYIDWVFRSIFFVVRIKQERWMRINT